MPRAKRSIKEGYPIATVFETRDQLEAYLSGNKITCLRCGHSYRILETHLRAVHNMTGDEYREIYGIPYRRGLCDSEFSAQRVEHGKAIFEQNPVRQMAALDQARIEQERQGYAQRSKPHFWKRERTKYERAHYDEFARRVLSGRPVRSVSRDPDMPTWSNVDWYRKRDADFAARWKATISPIVFPGYNLKGRAKRA